MIGNDLGIALIYAAGLFLSLIFLCYPERPDRNFIRFSISFICIFFIIPAIISAQNTEFNYLGRVFSRYQSSWLLVGLSAWAFLAGFFLRGFLIRRLVKVFFLGKSEIDYNYTRQTIIEKKRVFFFIIFAVSARLLVWKINPSAEEEYAVRTGIAAGSHLHVLLNIFFGSVYFAAIFMAARLKLHLATTGLLLGLLIVTFTGSTGRFNAALAVMMFSIYFFNLDVSKIALLFPFITISAFPILSSGKLLIFSISTGSPLPTVTEMFSKAIELESYLNNFAHPMVSLYQIDRLLALSDIRWFYDFPQGLLFYTRALGFDSGPSLTYYNTEAFLGYKASIVPTGYLAFGFAQLSYFGVFVMGAFYRSLYYFFQNMRYIRANLSPILSFYISFTTANTFYTGEFRTLILQFFLNIIIFNFCFWLTSKPRKKVLLPSRRCRPE